MAFKVPEFEEKGLTDFLVRMLAEQERVHNGYLTKNVANHSVLLQSPGGKVYEVKVNDAGVIAATLVSG
jgi:hypothetical protein